MGWLALSAVCQIPGALSDRIRRLDLCGVVPRWNFFAPTPGTWDYHLLYRDRLADGTITDWRELPIVEARRWTHAVWNPGRRYKKALFDLTTLLMRECGNSLQPIQISVPYLAMINHISALDRLPTSRATQFVIMSSFGYGSDREPSPMFVSAMHPL